MTPFSCTMRASFVTGNQSSLNPSLLWMTDRLVVSFAVPETALLDKWTPTPPPTPFGTIHGCSS